MSGFRSIESVTDRSNESLAGVHWGNLLATGCVGATAGLFIAYVRIPLGLPGHIAVFWMAPVIAARLALRSPVGATGGVLTAACTSLGLGGRFAGGLLHLPLIGFAAVLLDVVIGFAEQQRMRAWQMIPLLGVAGMLANLVCFVKRWLPMSSLKPHLIGGPWASLVSYACCGLAAGLVGAALGCGLRRFASRSLRSSD